MTVRTLARHLGHLADSFAIVNVATAASRLRDPEPLAGDLLVLTFDDGYADNAEVAWPVFEDQGATATFFLTTGFLDGEPLWFEVAGRALRALARPGVGAVASLEEALRRSLPAWGPDRSVFETVNRMKYLAPRQRERLVSLMSDLARSEGAPARPMSWEQARAIREAGGEIGAHTISHPILSKLERKEQEREIVGSRERIAAELGREPASFAYPNGSRRDFDATTRDIVARAGFEAACTTVRGSNDRASDRLCLNRLGVGEDSLAALDARLAGLFDERRRRAFSALARPRFG
ncbi:MAG TPA: polysaccharide deacetylase family protein [Thermoanaerobaculia bacterium]|nr:polysaccharide deacetylase family protein [Thermoanaerobaculia bacterium]